MIGDSVECWVEVARVLADGPTFIGPVDDSGGPDWSPRCDECGRQMLPVDVVRSVQHWRCACGRTGHSKPLE